MAEALFSFKAGTFNRSFFPFSSFTTQHAVTHGKSFRLPLHLPNSHFMMSKIEQEPLRMTPSGG
jgi:hypothetical protein